MRYKIYNVLKAAFVLMIAVALLLPASATVFHSEIQSTSDTLEKGTILSTVIYVDDDNTGGPWNGSLMFPYQHIQDGIDAAENGDEVYVYNGTYVENIVIFKSIILSGENKEITTIDCAGACSVVSITANDVVLSGFTITNSGSASNHAGVSVNAQQSIITKNNIIENKIGIRAIEPNNQIYLNNFMDNDLNAYDEENNSWDDGNAGNFWDDYKGIDENEDGRGDTAYDIVDNVTRDSYPLMHWYGSIKNLDEEKIFLTIQDAIDDSDTYAGDTIFVQSDIYYEHLIIDKPINVTGENNKDTIIDGRKLGSVVCIAIGEKNPNAVCFSGFTIQNSGTDTTDAGIEISSDGNTISHNIITNNYHGICFKGSSENNEISYNTIRDNNWNGIYLQSECALNKGNIIFENSIENNNYAGIGIEGSSYNFIYHNDFIGNLLNAYDDSNNIWDDGYPSGGNYWDDYTGSDTNGDGIGDIPYEIENGINKDQYPIMEPMTGLYVKIISPQNGLYFRNMRVLPFIFRQNTLIFGAVDIQVEAYAQSGIEKIEFYIDANASPDGTVSEPPYRWTWRGGSLIQSRHSVLVVAYDTSGNFKTDSISVRKFF